MTKRNEEKGDPPMDLALAAIEAIEAAGLIIMPVDPTPDMIRAGQQAGGVSARKAEDIYKAMTRAAP